VPKLARTCLAALGAQLRVLKAQILEFEYDQSLAQVQQDEQGARRDSRRWPRASPALVAGVADPRLSIGPRFLGLELVLRLHSAGAGKGLALSASEVIAICAACSQPGALDVIRYAKEHGTEPPTLAHRIVGAAVNEGRRGALANEMARMAWAMMASVSATRNLSHSRRERDRAGRRHDVKGVMGN
jgi:transposase